jgi:hypothetical protein
MTERTTPYDSTTSREPRAGERSGAAAGTGTGGNGRDQDDLSERERARRAAEEIKSAAKEAAVNTAGAVRNRLTGELDYRKYRSRQRLGRVVTALRQASTDVGTEDELIGRYIERAADRTERLAAYLDQKDVNEIVHDARELARRRPELFVGGLFIVGLALGRFLRSSAPDGGNGHGHENYDAGTDPESGVYSGSRSYTGAAGTGAAVRPATTSTPKPDGGLVP